MLSKAENNFEIITLIIEVIKSEYKLNGVMRLKGITMLILKSIPNCFDDIVCCSKEPVGWSCLDQGVMSHTPCLDQVKSSLPAFGIASPTHWSAAGKYAFGMQLISGRCTKKNECKLDQTWSKSYPAFASDGFYLLVFHIMSWRATNSILLVFEWESLEGG